MTVIEIYASYWSEFISNRAVNFFYFILSVFYFAAGYDDAQDHKIYLLRIPQLYPRGDILNGIQKNIRIFI